MTICKNMYLKFTILYKEKNLNKILLFLFFVGLLSNPFMSIKKLCLTGYNSPLCFVIYLMVLFLDVAGSLFEKQPLELNPDTMNKYFCETFLMGNEIRYRCTKCCRHYKYKPTLFRHLYYECGVPKKYSCFLCNAKFRRNTHLQSHVLNVHNIEQREKI